MEIGQLVLYEGRVYYLRGLEPMSVPCRLADLEDAESGETLRAPVSKLRETFDEEAAS